VVQNCNFSYFQLNSSYPPKYQIKLRIPSSLYKSGYPTKINTIGDLVRKTRMDLDLEVKQLANKLGMCEQAIINLEKNRSQSRPHLLKKVVEFLRPHVNGSMPDKDFWDLCFKNNPLYPKQQNTFGDKLRSTRMQNFLSIPNLAKELGVDPTSVAKWERMESKPIPKYKKRVLAWIKKI